MLTSTLILLAAASAAPPVVPTTIWRQDLPIGSVEHAVRLDLPSGPALLTTPSLGRGDAVQLLHSDGVQLTAERRDLGLGRVRSAGRADVDGDGFDEIVLLLEHALAVLDPATLQVRLQIPRAASTSALFTDLSLGDLDGDGIAELIAIDELGMVEVHDGAGTLRGSFDATLGQTVDPSYPVLLAELDGTPGLELLTDVTGGLRDGDLSSLASLAFPTNPDETSPARAVDLDGDGIDELLLFAEQTLVAIDATGLVRWTLSAPGDAYPNGTVELVDLGHDGSLELLVGWQGVPATTLRVLDPITGAQLGQIAVPNAATSTLRALSWDADDDGDDELALYGAGAWTTFDLASEAWEQRSWSIGLRAQGTHLADFDGDGTPELTMSSDAPGAEILLLDPVSGQVLQATQAAIARGTPTYNSSVVGDFDGDGRPELALGAIDRVDLYDVSRSSGAVFQRSVTLPAVTLLRKLVAADTNGDGVDELFALHHVSRVAFVDLVLGTSWSRSVESVNSITAADLNGDGRDALLVGSTTSGLAVLSATDGRTLRQLPGQWRDMLAHPTATGSDIIGVVVNNQGAGQLGRVDRGANGVQFQALAPTLVPGSPPLYSTGGLLWMSASHYAPYTDVGLLGVDLSTGARWLLPDVTAGNGAVAARGNAIFYAAPGYLSRASR